ncbi:unnamed protein product, partial [Hapterophycus canaliculatus]
MCLEGSQVTIRSLKILNANTRNARTAASRNSIGVVYYDERTNMSISLAIWRGRSKTLSFSRTLARSTFAGRPVCVRVGRLLHFRVTPESRCISAAVMIACFLFFSLLALVYFFSGMSRVRGIHTTSKQKLQPLL